MPKHLIVVTGPPGVGKTTFIRTVVSEVKKTGEKVIEGFYTEEVRANGLRTGFGIVTLDGKRAVLATTQAQQISCPRVGKYQVVLKSLEETVLPILNKTKDRKVDILVIDEVGKMELLSSGFKRSITKLLDSFPTNCSSLLVSIPVAKGSPIPIVERIRTHQMATVVNLTKSNREDPSVMADIVNQLRTV